jgi:spore coat polysaccharide biosynthesis protein SpsF
MHRNGKVNGHKIVPTVVAVIQARMGSKRLPGKSMKKLCKKPILAHVIERAQAIEGVSKVVVATCKGDENSQIIDLAKEMKAKVFIGSEENVLERYYQAVKKHGGDYIVRITADNPFLDVDYASMAVEIAAESGADLSSVINLPLGTAVEVIKSEALFEAYNLSDTAYHLEHVTPYIKEHPEFFTIQRHPINIDNPFDKLRLTVDTEDDFELAKNIFKANYYGEPFSIQTTINYLKENQHLIKINSHVKQRPMTHVADAS